jgi:hypothetical protein
VSCARPFVLCGIPLRRPPAGELTHHRQNGKFLLEIIAHPRFGSPTVRDRVAQTAAKLVLEPSFEADLEPCAYGDRPQRSAQDDIQKVPKLLRAGYTEIVDADLSKYLDAASYCPLIHESWLKSVAC